MTTLNLKMIGALSAKDIDITWDDLVSKYQPLVNRLQIRIAKAILEGKHGKAKSLQWLLTHSFAAKIIAIKRVTSNKGKRTAGVDKVRWSNSLSKIKAISSLNRRGYKVSPLRRIYIPKKNRGERPLGIPTMKDRAMQALHLLAFEPVVESIMEPNYYGFRPYRSSVDAIVQCCNCLAKRSSSQWVLESDIKSCFDEIDHNWLINNINMDKQVLNKWLKSGFIDKNQFYSTKMGTPQGGIISPALTNFALNGMESLFKDFPLKYKVHIIVYADDFVVTASSKEILQELVKPRIEAFLKERGLELSREKTSVTHIADGFDFLGFNMRKYKGKFTIKPSKGSVKNFLKNVKELVKANKTAKAESLIHLLNPKIRGWANYYRNSAASRAFVYVDHRIFWTLWRWARRKHQNKGARWTRKKYYRSNSFNNSIFHVKTKNQNKVSYFDLINARKTSIIPHVKIKGRANPFDPTYEEYFKNRKIGDILRNRRMIAIENKVIK